MDGQAHLTETQTNSDPLGTSKIDTTYDYMGRGYVVSNPYYTTSDTIYGNTTNTYDALGRVTKTTHTPDNNYSSISYSGTCSTATDEAGKSRTSCSDALGRLTVVFEDPLGLNYETTYQYDALGNLMCVHQMGGTATDKSCTDPTVPASWRPRVFTYNSMGQLLTALNPESGFIIYTYDKNGNTLTRVAPAPNQTGSASVTTTYAYDGLNRLTQKSYNDGTTSPAYFSFDLVPAWGIPVSNIVGRLAWEHMDLTKPRAASIFSYDSMGRVLMNDQCVPQNGTGCGPSAFSVTYTYDLAGNMLSYTTGPGAVFSQSFDSAGRLMQLTSSYVDGQHPATLATVDTTVGYDAAAHLRKLTLGNGLTQTDGYNNRMQRCRGNLNSSGTVLSTCGDSMPSGNVQDMMYSHYLSGASNNGNLLLLTGTGAQTMTRSYGYDSLNRLWTMSDSASSATCKGLSWTYDAWANRTDQTQTSGTCFPAHFLAGANNQLGTPYTYDSAGNTTFDGTHHYFYDAENRIVQVDGTQGSCSGATACYLYDALGRRAQKTAGSAWLNYIYDLSGHVVTEYSGACGSPCWATSYIYLKGQLTAQYSAGTTYFVHRDQVGSTRLVTALNKSIIDNLDYQPFGEQTSGATSTTHKFTGTERDAETGLDYFGARFYQNTMGRFFTPDWAAKPITVPYASFGDPQTLNLYSYVENGPVNRVDADGHIPCDSGSRACNLFQEMAAGAGQTYMSVSSGLSSGSTGHPQDAESIISHCTAICAAGATGKASSRNWTEIRDRSLALVGGIGNLVISGHKILGAAGAGIAGPATLGASEIPATYLAINGTGQGVTGGFQIAYAVTGNRQAKDASEVASAVTTFSGLATLLITRDMHKAAFAASMENMMVFASAPPDSTFLSHVDLWVNMYESADRGKAVCEDKGSC
jgi:RHS repeat-associated protein